MAETADAIVRDWRQAILDAGAKGKALRLVGGGSKDFYGQSLAGTPLSTLAYTGITAYEPTELFLTARCGTTLASIEAALAEKGQMLAFEPPHFAEDATVGGCVAAGLSGPRRARAGAVRDYVLGIHLLNGKGELLSFGGQVMKNVAGYDVSRLLAGSMGILGLIADVTLKVTPRPVAETTLALNASQEEALALMNRWAGQPLPVSATCWHEGRLTLRLSGAAAAVRAAAEKIGGSAIADADAFWQALREQRADFFTKAMEGKSLWRLSVPSTTPQLPLPGQPLIEWNGALRWLWADDAAVDLIRRVVGQAGGHATLFRASDATKERISVFHPLQAPLAAIHRNLKGAFDPQGVFNPGRLYREL